MFPIQDKSDGIYFTILLQSITLARNALSITLMADSVPSVRHFP